MTLKEDMINGLHDYFKKHPSELSKLPSNHSNRQLLKYLDFILNRNGNEQKSNEVRQLIKNARNERIQKELNEKREEIRENYRSEFSLENLDTILAAFAIENGIGGKESPEKLLKLYDSILTPGSNESSRFSEFLKEQLSQQTQQAAPNFTTNLPSSIDAVTELLDKLGFETNPNKVNHNKKAIKQVLKMKGNMRKTY
jgi:ABC-type oligopeptide transport system substrate-binding subunit